MKLISLIIALVFISTISAQAVSLATLISACGDDSKLYCKGVGYGAPMQVCLVASKAKLNPGCKMIVARLEKGEKVHIFGN